MNDLIETRDILVKFSLLKFPDVGFYFFSLFIFVTFRKGKCKSWSGGVEFSEALASQGFILHSYEDAKYSCKL